MKQFYKCCHLYQHNNPNTDFGFVWEMTTGGVVGYVNFETQSLTSLLPVGFMHYGPTTNQQV